MRPSFSLSVLPSFSPAPCSLTPRWLLPQAPPHSLRHPVAHTSACSPVMVILADHLEVPSSTLCFTVFICCTWATLLTVKTSRITSKISGLFRSRIFMRSFMAMIMFWVRSSAPCLELFSAAPEGRPETERRVTNRPPTRPRVRLRNGAWEISLRSGGRLGYR